MTNIIVPDIGGAHIPVIELHIKVGDWIEKDAPILTLESDKASMDIPAPSSGTITAVHVNIGDTLSQGDVIAQMTQKSADEVAQNANTNTAQNIAPSVSTLTNDSAITKTAAATKIAENSETAQVAKTPLASSASNVANQATGTASPSETSASHASPSVRKFARELGANLALIQGTAAKGRITEADVRQFIKQQLTQQASASQITSQTNHFIGHEHPLMNVLPWPTVDFEKFGTITAVPLSRIKKISGANLHRNWVMIPHVTNHDQADITALEAFRIQVNAEYEKQGSKTKLTMLAFLIKACAVALKHFPEFNASLMGESLILKEYVNIGFAADTPNGLVVPVIKQADQKSISAIAIEMQTLALSAREGKLKAEDMQGGCFSISSLGGIGGTSFTPIINAPEVAILGVSKSSMQAVWDETTQTFMPKLILPLSLSWDHRVIDGAQAARFNVLITRILADFRRITL